MHRSPHPSIEWDVATHYLTTLTRMRTGDMQQVERDSELLCRVFQHLFVASADGHQVQKSRGEMSYNSTS